MDKKIPVNDLQRRDASSDTQIEEAIARVLRSGWFVLGPEVRQFEEEFGRYCGAAHCVGTANGTDALEICLRALGIGLGRKVATVANAGGYATNAILATGAQPAYVDVSHETLLIDTDALKACVEKQPVDAIIVTHLFGRMAEMDKIMELVRHSKVPIIEDCAQAHGARLGSRVAGSIGTAGCFSFYPTKNLGAIGDGGLIATSDGKLADRLRSLRQYGWQSKYEVSLSGGRNSRLDELQAAVLRAKLPHLDRWNERRRQIARRYNASIQHDRIEHWPVGGSENVCHLYVIACPDRANLRRHLQSFGVSTDVHYPIPDHHQPAWRALHPHAHLENTERFADCLMTLPCFPTMTDDEIDQVATAVNSW